MTPLSAHPPISLSPSEAISSPEFEAVVDVIPVVVASKEIVVPDLVRGFENVSVCSKLA